MRFAVLVLSAASMWCIFSGLWTLRQATAEQPSQSEEAGVPPVSVSNVLPADAVARIYFPTLHSSRNVFSGTVKKNGRRGPVWLEASAEIGSSGNAILAGHRDTHFRILKDLRVNDEIVVENASGEYRYRVEKLSIVPPTDRRLLRQNIASSLTLVTCYPFWFVGSAPKRFIVQAGLVTGPANHNH